ncbi:MAG TPA: C2H2-type zinc finger protein [Nitrososphaera sp.]|nr:C2H2-type zinc finger protein [Nitrososphaera sp.]
MPSNDELKKESPYKCSLCDRAFPERAELEMHQSTTHRESVSV